MFFAFLIHLAIYFILIFIKYTGNKKIINILFLCYYLSYLIVYLINPGIPERKYASKFFKDRSNKNKYIKCTKCNIIMLKSSMIGHCIYCDVCVIKQDHHCPWTGKCIGKNNRFFFLGFIISLFIYITFIFCLFIKIYFKLKRNVK